MENVEEIQQWGPLDADGHPIKERRGEDYQKFITAMKSLGYVFDCRAQGQQIRREAAWEYLQRRCGLRGDADGDNEGIAPGIPE